MLLIGEHRQSLKWGGLCHIRSLNEGVIKVTVEGIIEGFKLKLHNSVVVAGIAMSISAGIMRCSGWIPDDMVGVNDRSTCIDSSHTGIDRWSSW